MMDGAYFVGRKELLDFFNNLLALKLTKIEQTASGAIACQLTSLIFPNSIPMSRVNWEARNDYEFIQNYKLLQNAFTKNNVQRYVDVDKLIRAKYQDNLEFCQWLKAFFDQAGAVPEDYDPIVVRARGKGGKKYQFNATAGTRSSGASKKTANPSRPRPTAVAATSVGASAPQSSRPLRERSSTNKSSDNRGPPRAENEAALKEQKEMNADLQRRNDELTIKMVELEQAVIDIEKERDFYFNKLRDVEILFQVHQEKVGEEESIPLMDDVFKILYAAAEDKLTVNDDGEVVQATAEVEG